MRVSRIAVVIVGFSLSVAASAEEMDPHEVTIDEIASDDVLKAVEKRFAEIFEIKGLLRNSRSCFHHVTNDELRRLRELRLFCRRCPGRAIPARLTIAKTQTEG